MARKPRPQITTRQEIVPDVNLLPPNLPYYRMDDKYWTCTWEDMVKIIDYDWLNRRHWIAEEFDCDDFALAFKSHLSERWGVNAVGFVVDWSSFHAYNVIFTPDNGMVVFEPQSDMVVAFGTDPYKGEQGFVVL